MARLNAEKCQAWNDAQVARAYKVINEERARGNHYVAPTPDDVLVRGWNHSDIRKVCPDTPEGHTETGCSSGNDVAVNADRDPSAIAFTMEHEFQHINGGYNQTPAGQEPCARARAVRFLFDMSREHYRAARRDPFVYTEPQSAPGCGF
jgi:hypothetical protein